MSEVGVVNDAVDNGTPSSSASSPRKVKLRTGALGVEMPSTELMTDAIRNVGGQIASALKKPSGTDIIDNIIRHLEILELRMDMFEAQMA